MINGSGAMCVWRSPPADPGYRVCRCGEGGEPLVPTKSRGSYEVVNRLFSQRQYTSFFCKLNGTQK